ncbi:2OG-Fe(II) oxygenase [Solimonas sp. SE-A11]|uniref:2OG-Fe(II) oxygenase n=1 Tax=Solimonas sp. SE-A11 TaxID=3054954 RepID=UPI00259CEBF0|nr:2OG-Fe(II) oxygenase [Solimonas sp. SE-A11]MDM4772583.1 2OG-Fe(II) oxygenase [Solimonas sp. SE-A11]
MTSQSQALLRVPSKVVVDGFLGAERAAALHALAIKRQPLFEPAVLGGGHLLPGTRTALRYIGAELPTLFYEHFAARVPDLQQALGMPGFTDYRAELELTAYGDGCFYRRHIDTSTGKDARWARQMSMVYYLHQSPRTYEGGAIRFHAPVGAAFEDIDSRHDRLVAFASWMPHEVLPVRCTDDRFEQRRFALNIWLRTLQLAPT